MVMRGRNDSPDTWDNDVCENHMCHLSLIEAKKINSDVWFDNQHVLTTLNVFVVNKNNEKTENCKVRL